MNIDDFQKDLADLQRLLTLAATPYAKTLLQNSILALRNSRPSPPLLTKLEDKKPSSSFSDVSKYSWEQETKEVRVLLMLEKVKEECGSGVSASFEEQSFNCQIVGYQGKNLRLKIPRLNGKIDPAKSSFQVKKNYVQLNLSKKDTKHWDALVYKQSIEAPKEGETKEDPNGALMNMMKKMYEEGDDDMKRTIAQAWSKSNSEKK